MVVFGAPGAVVVVPDSGKVGSTSANTAMVSPALKNGSRSHRRHQWAKNNRFSPLSDLGNEMGTKFGEGEDRVEAVRTVASVRLSPNDSGPLFLPWNNSGVDNCDGGNGVKNNCLLECNLETRWNPNSNGEVVLIQDDIGGVQVAETKPNSSWVSQLMKDFCNMVGFPIVKHEVQCLALFRLLEQECLKVIDDGVPKQPTNSGSRGLRELKRLISNVNYDGVSSRSRSRAPSNVVGGVGSFK